MQADTLSMLRVVQLPAHMQPLEMGGCSPGGPGGLLSAPAAPAATCVLLPLPPTVAEGSPLRLQTLGETLNNNNNNNNNTVVTNNNLSNSSKMTTKVYKKIQPATPDMAKCKRKISFNSTAGQQGATPGLYTRGRNKAASVARRNERERNRVKQVNQGFERLRQHVPNGAENKKMSKVDTLRSALEYIHYMQDLLDQTDPAGHSAGSAGFPAQSDLTQHMVPQSHLELLGCENLSPPHSVESSLPSPSGYSTDSTATGPQPCPASELERAPLSPEQDELLDLATFWLMQSS